MISVLCTFIVASLSASSALHAQTVTAKPSATSNSPWSFSASAAVRETFDDNVFLQDRSELARKRSLVTAFMPSVTLGYSASPSLKVSFSYAPDVVFYHSQSSEDHVAHRATFNLSGKSGDTAWESNNAVTWIDGSDMGVTFDTANGGDIPALGGIPIRDRRDAIIFRQGTKVTQTFGKWFARPVFSAYAHNFKTQQSATTGYENYIDRSDLNGGVDVGYKTWEKAWLVMGYRFGSQHQGKRLGVTSDYNSRYHRLLFGVEGAPTQWLRLNVLAGPEFRHFHSPNLPAYFDRDKTLLFADASARLTLGKNDTVTLLMTRQQLPAYASHSVFEDIVYSVGWRHQFNEKLAATMSVKLHIGDWQAPTNREDWIYTTAVGVSYAFNKKLSADCSWSYDHADSKVPNTSGRDFMRHLVSLGTKCSF